MTAAGRPIGEGHALWDLVRTAHLAQRRLGEVFAAHGLTPAQYGVLASLADGDDLSPAELARSVLVRPQSLASVVNTLVEAGLIVRDGRPGRGRRKALSLSERGRELVASARPAAYRLLSPEVTGLNREETGELVALLAIVREHLGDSEPDRPPDASTLAQPDAEVQSS